MTAQSGLVAAVSARWRRWRKYPPHHLVVGAVHRCWRVVGRLRRRAMPAAPAPVSWQGDLAAGLAERLGVPCPVPGGGIPGHAPFRPIALDDLLRRAERAVQHRVDLLGSGPVDHGPALEWHWDPKSGARWPVEPVHRLPVVIAPGADVKMPWELGRFHHAAPLILAYLATGEETWASEVRAQVHAFIRCNPAGMGVQWLSAMDVAIRASTWSWGLLALAAGPHLPVREAEAWLGALAQHGRWIRSHLSWNPHSRGNHYLTELVGLLHVGLVLGHTAEGRRWARFAARRIRHEMRHQVRPDGLDGEASTNYHRLVTELFAQAAELVRTTAVPLALPPDEEYDRRLAAMLRAVADWTRPDGTAPLVGDVDDGRLLAFAAPDDPRCHLESLEPYGPPPVGASSRAYPDGGLYVLRGRDALVVVRCGPVGLHGRGAHDHADQLAVDVTFGGVPLFVDPGTYLYTSDPRLRQAFRATAAHNTLALDGLDQVTFTALSLFEIEEGAAATTMTWDAAGRQTRFAGCHSGYARRCGGAVHERQVVLSEDGSALRIVDAVVGRPGRHEVRITWQCDPAVVVESVDETDGAVLLRAGGRAVRLSVAEPGGLQWVVEEGWVAPRYGVRVPAPRVVLTGPAATPAQWTFDVSIV